MDVDPTHAADPVPVPMKASSSSTTVWGAAADASVAAFAAADAQNAVDEPPEASGYAGASEKKPWWKTHQKQAWKKTFLLNESAAADEELVA